MSARPWMPFYINDFRLDTLDLKADQVGVYMVLLMLAWRRQDAALPNDMPWLKTTLKSCIAEFHGHQFNRIVPSILERYFKLGKDGKYHNKRLTKERQITDKRSANARKNSRKRWSKTKKNNDLENAKAMLSQSQSQSQLSSSLRSEDNKPRSLRSRGVRARGPYPENFEPSREHASKLGFADSQIAVMAEAFRNHHTAKGSLMADWDAAWRTWCANEIKYGIRGGTGNGKTAPQRTGKDAFRAELDRARAELIARHGGDGGPDVAGGISARKPT